eukprot:m.13489 g.13489  ORF g.13489 m.13489 type:complete len:449 (+) comp24878_c0_seq1:1249-2595(+)
MESEGDSSPRLKYRPRRQRLVRRKLHAASSSPTDSDDDSSGTSDTWYHHHEVNQKQVDNVTVEFFYKPRTLTLLVVVLVAMCVFSFSRDESNTDYNITTGAIFMVIILEVISVLAFPNGPFIRPHPAIWRMAFGLSVAYLLLLIFMLFQKFSDIFKALRWLDPSLEGKGPDMTDYAADCSFTLENVWTRIDIFIIGHLLGWILKAMVIRDAILCWVNSIVWEVTEVAFAHLLVNFNECWWDIWILDIIVCNGLGIIIGLYICKKLEMKNFNWASIKDLPHPRDKIKRAVLQFTPESWTHVRWLDPSSTYMRYFAISSFVLIWQISELNTFFLKHIFSIPTSNLLNVYRLLLIGLMAAPSIRQYYVYCTDKTCKRMGTQAWVFIACTFLECLVCIKCGKELFAQTLFDNIVFWVIFQLLTCLVVLFAIIYISQQHKKKKAKLITKRKKK